MMSIDGRTRVLGLLGDPVCHTLSPDIHNYLSDRLGINSIYVPFHTKPVGLYDAVKGAYEMHIGGLNCTVPHKNEVMKYLTDIDEGARAIGSVNTLVRTDGGYKGYNTDMMGLYRELMVYDISLKGKPVIILGAGGAAKAVIYMCMKYGASVIYLLNRTKEKALELSAYYAKLFHDDNRIIPMSLSAYEDIPRDKYIIFQATSIGLAPDNDRVAIEDEAFYELCDIGIDLIYNPFETRFMKSCRAAGGKAYNGLRMLLYQGIIAYELWHDISISEEVADEVYDILMKRVRGNIVLIGFMGCGKTTIGQKLASDYGYEFIDTDDLIEKRCGCSINEIFATKGEAYFREMETEILRELTLKASHAVISTGGGLPLRQENADLLQRLGRVVFLDITENEVISRLRGDLTRPLLSGDDPEGRVHELISYRKPIYSAAADVTIDVSGRSVVEIVAELMN